MTPVRALIASLFAATIFGAGAFIAASLGGGRPHDLVPLLSLGRTPFSLWCFLAAWGAIVIGVLGVLAAFLAFIAPEEEDDPRFRRRGFPKSAPLILIAIALGLVWLALRCADAAAAPPIAVAIELETVAGEDPADLSGEPAPAANAPGTDNSPAPIAEAAAFQWPYKIPLVRDNSAIWSGDPEPFSDDDEARRLLCGKAWLAVTGSSSEEGPAERNVVRARLRAGRAMAQASGWLSRHEDCGPTIVFGIDLGQHARVTGRNDDGAASAYQRQVLVVSRTRRSADESLSAGAAEEELRAFLQDPAARAALYAGRTFPAEPQILAPTSRLAKDAG